MKRIRIIWNDGGITEVHCAQFNATRGSNSEQGWYILALEDDDMASGFVAASSVRAWYDVGKLEATVEGYVNVVRAIDPAPSVR